jgi:hypothetical protein
VNNRYEDLVEAINESLDEEHFIPPQRPELWDGQAASRITEVMCNL